MITADAPQKRGVECVGCWGLKPHKTITIGKKTEHVINQVTVALCKVCMKKLRDVLNEELQGKK